MSLVRSGRWSVKVGLAAVAVLAILALHVGRAGAQAPAGGAQGGGAGRGAGGGGGRGAGGGAGAPAGGAAPAAAQGGGRAAPVISGDPILVGTIDLHAHQGPDNRARSIDFLDAARYAKLRGMRGLVFKSHQDPTAIQAYIARKEVPGFEAFGTIDLNLAIGGMNPDAIEHFVKVTMPGAPPQGYGQMVMMSSEDSEYQVIVSKGDVSHSVHIQKNGVLLPEVKVIIGLIKKYNLSMTTGHNSGAEAILMIKEAIAQGIRPDHTSVTHANINPPGLTVDEMKQVAALGGFVEMCSQSQRAFTPEAQKALDTRNDRIADMIKQVGADHVIMETDLGQAGNEYHPDGLAAFVRNMRARGLSPADTDKMTKDNPAKFLGVPLMQTPPSQ